MLKRKGEDTSSLEEEVKKIKESIEAYEELQKDSTCGQRYKRSQRKDKLAEGDKQLR